MEKPLGKARRSTAAQGDGPQARRHRRSSNAEHEFGSQATELKLSVVDAYLHAFTASLRRKFPEL